MKQTGLVRQCKGEGHYFIGIMVEGRERQTYIWKCFLIKKHKDFEFFFSLSFFLNFC